MILRYLKTTQILLILIPFIFSLSYFAHESLESSEIRHKPSDDFTTVIVQFSEKPHDYKNLIKDLGGEVIHDYDIIEGVAIKVPNDKIENLQNIENVLKIHEDKKVRALLHESAPMISADKVWEQGITGKDVKVCILDTGLDYTHPAFGSCSIYFLNGNTETYVLESEHPYEISSDITWTITKPGYTNIAVHFVTIALEVDDGIPYDFIYIKDANGTTVQTFTGWETNVWSVSVPGDTIKINLVSDWYGCRYGFYMDKVLNGTVSVSYENCSKVVAGYDFMDNDNDPMDDGYHGTHVTGIVSSDDEYYRGIANGTKILVGKVLYSGGGTYSSVIAGIDWCVNNSAQIISMSLGGAPYPGNCDEDALAEAANNATEKGIAVVVSSGNVGMNGLTTPACASGAIAVGSVDKVSDVAASSSKGSELDLVAPGRWITSAVPGGWDTSSGTSMAAPHVTGVIALMLEETPELSVNEIKIALNETSDPVNKCYECEWDEGYCMGYYEIECDWNVTGAGIVNASRAVEYIETGDLVLTVKYNDGCPVEDALVRVWKDEPQNEVCVGYTNKDGILICENSLFSTCPYLYDVQVFKPDEVLKDHTTAYVDEVCEGSQTSTFQEPCPSGNCVDGYCCDSACTGTCEICNLTGNEGLCTFIPFGQDPKDGCPVDSCKYGYCDGVGACNMKPLSSLCEADQQFCTIDNCDSLGNCVYLEERNCTDDLYCTINEYCNETVNACLHDDRDCSANDIPGIATCNNVPDSNPFTWDYRQTFTSVCDEDIDICTSGSVRISYICNDDDLFDTVTHRQCGAPCDEDSDCLSGICLNDCTCVPAIIPNVTIVSPEEKNYSVEVVWLNVTTDLPVDSWWYSINSGSNISFTPNEIIDVEECFNDLTVYATAGQEGSSSVSFNALTGDAQGDLDVDIFDIVKCAGAYGKNSGQPGFKPECDINPAPDGNGKIDIFDIVKMAGNYGKSC